MVGLSNVLLPASVIAKFCPVLKSTAMFAASVRLTISATAAVPIRSSFPRSASTPIATALT